MWCSSATTQTVSSVRASSTTWGAGGRGGRARWGQAGGGAPLQTSPHLHRRAGSLPRQCTCKCTCKCKC